MKRYPFALLLAFGFAALCACAPSANQLNTVKSAENDYSVHSDVDYLRYEKSAEQFSARFSEATCTQTTENVAVSPLSVFIALNLAAECASGETRAEILGALGVSYEEMQKQFPRFYGTLERTQKNDFGKLISALTPANSIWLDESVKPEQACLDKLGENYYCECFSADFINKNTDANRALQNFVKQKTKGLIDQDFDLDKSTRFALVNSLYLKDVWNLDGNDLPFTQDRYDFTEADGTKKNVPLLRGYYFPGRAYAGENFTSFFTRTQHGYKIKFLLPDKGVSANELMKAQTITKLNSLDSYSETDDKRQERYFTRCLFPEYKASYNGEIKEILKDNFSLPTLFSPERCDFTSLVKVGNLYCNSVQHVAKLEVNKKGVEGAAVTVLGGAASAAPPEYTPVYLDFTVDRSFAYLLTDSHDVILFSGVVNKI